MCIVTQGNDVAECIFGGSNGNNADEYAQVEAERAIRLKQEAEEAEEKRVQQTTEDEYMRMKQYVEACDHEKKLDTQRRETERIKLAQCLDARDVLRREMEEHQYRILELQHKMRRLQCEWEESYSGCHESVQRTAEGDRKVDAIRVFLERVDKAREARARDEASVPAVPTSWKGDVKIGMGRPFE